jgi:hypothetical protein
MKIIFKILVSRKRDAFLLQTAVDNQNLGNDC